MAAANRWRTMTGYCDWSLSKQAVKQAGRQAGWSSSKLLSVTLPAVVRCILWWYYDLYLGDIRFKEALHVMKRNTVIVVVVVAVLVLALAGTALAANFNAPANGLALAVATPAAAQGYAGISVSNISAQVAQQLNLSQTSGVVIVAVEANSPAAAAGLQRGDVVTAINGASVATAKDVTNLISKLAPGATATFNVTRGTQKMSIDVTVGTRSAGAGKGFGSSLPSDLGSLMQGLRGLAQGELFNHNLGSTRTLKDATGNTVTIYTIPGTVTAVSAGSITLTPNNPQSSGGPFSIDSTTVIRIPGTANATAANVKVGDKVVVVTIGTTNHASSISEAGLNGLGGGDWGGFAGPGGFNGRGFGPRGGMRNFQAPNGNGINNGNGNGTLRNFPGGRNPITPRVTPVPGTGA
jgi:membrane-associated protease RseP (regulator of RpoE activity)